MIGALATRKAPAAESKVAAVAYIAVKKGMIAVFKAVNAVLNAVPTILNPFDIPLKTVFKLLNIPTAESNQPPRSMVPPVKSFNAPEKLSNSSDLEASSIFLIYACSASSLCTVASSRFLLFLSFISLFLAAAFSSALLKSPSALDNSSRALAIDS